MNCGESFICAQCKLDKGRFLAFLRKDGDMWVGANWQNSLRPFSREQIEWFDVDRDMTWQAQDSVLSEVRWILGGGKVTADIDIEKKPALTLAARLRSAAASEQEIASAIQNHFKSLLGMKTKDLSPAQRELIRSLAAKQLTVAKEIESVTKELGIQTERDENAVSKQVLLEIQASQVPVRFEKIAERISTNNAYTACDEASAWSQKMVEWADRMDAKPGVQGFHGANEKHRWIYHTLLVLIACMIPSIWAVRFLKRRSKNL